MASRHNRAALSADGRKPFRRRLLAWYDLNRRDLPWRDERNPYRVWLSEIMLQQTRVAAVIGHYEKFLQRFPSMKQLAVARQPSVLAAWSGLGYYRRARMLHAAVKQVVRERSGRLPTSAKELRTLPGIGRYTAAAIASIAFGEPVAVVDGNVERVLGRMLGRPRDPWQAAKELLDRQRPGDFNQAMMELGATVCLPRRPQCEACPVYGWCATRGEMDNPAKKIRQTKRDVHYGLAWRNGSVFLVRRPEDASLMAGMWELPEIANASGVGDACLTLRHSIMATDYLVRVVPSPAPQDGRGTWVATSRLDAVPLTGLARKILRVARVI